MAACGASEPEYQTGAAKGRPSRRYFMSKAFAVIGAAYGDEGKGRNVDALAAALSDDVIVVRSNGGAQAGHTVVTPDGLRHVFHHVGSGTFAGAATHLSQFFVHHPMSFGTELNELADLGFNPKISADRRGIVTTPWDMMMNQMLEASRGGKRHGSCGYGFGETVGRNEETPFGLTVADLYRSDLSSLLIAIRDEWLPSRMSALNVTADEETREAIVSPIILDAFLSDCAVFADRIEEKSDADLAGGIIFEAAQGLMLDQRSIDFPHVTRSNTGIENIVAIAKEAGIAAIDAIYASRSYLTRHGAGPMPNEQDISSWIDVVDETNVSNPWQQSLRFGILDARFLHAAVSHDLRKAKDIHVRPFLAMSCLDQIKDDFRFLNRDGAETKIPIARAVPEFSRAAGFSQFIEAWGPSRRDQDLTPLQEMRSDMNKARILRPVPC